MFCQYLGIYGSKYRVAYLKMLVKTFLIDWQSNLKIFKFDHFLQKMMM